MSQLNNTIIIRNQSQIPSCRFGFMQLQKAKQQQLGQAQETFNHEAQSIIASTILQIDELQDAVVSQLASQFENKLRADHAHKPQTLNLPDQTSQEVLYLSVQQTLSLLIEVKFYLTLLVEMYLSDKWHNDAIKQIQEHIHKFRKVILLVQSQMSMILWIVENREIAHFRQRYFDKFNELQQFAIQLQKVKDGFINIKMVVQALQTVKQVLNQYIDSIIQFKQSIQKKRRLKYLLRGLNRLCVINAKVITISQVLPYCCTVPKQDLFSYTLTDPRWQKLICQCIIFRSFADKQVLKQSFDDFKRNLNLVNATMGVLNKSRRLPLLNLTSWFQIARSSKYIMKLVLFKDAAKKQAQYMISSANTQLMKQVWNLPQHKIFRDFAQFILPSIQHSQRLYIPRVARQYFNSNGKDFPHMKIPFLSLYGNELFKKKKYSETLRIRINSKYKLTPKFSIIDEKIKKLSQGTGLIVKRIQNAFIGLASMCGYRPKYVPEKIIFHIHGGGFISMSSFIHQIYTRTWSKQLQVPIISVDYGKAPEYPYPYGLYDCLEAYLWTLYSFEQIYQAQPKKIIFLGDSAGGNLAAALINLCIAWKLRVPDGLVMCYPVLSVTSKKYTKSLLGTLEDMILPHTLLKLCQNSYAQNKQRQDDPLISPLFTPSQFLSKYPETKIFVGSRDPFHDDCCRFTQRMKQFFVVMDFSAANPGKCLLTILEEFPHGFLQFDIKTHPHYYGRKANDQICKVIGEMFDRIQQRTEQQQQQTEQK